MIRKIAWLLTKILQELRYQTYLREASFDNADIPYTKRRRGNGNN